MSYDKNQLEELKTVLESDVREHEEGGYTYIYIPGLKMPPGCSPDKADALLCPQSHSGYPSRLFLREQVKTPKSVNWNGQVYVLGQQWFAFSYSGIENMSLLNMVMNHLRGMAI